MSPSRPFILRPVATALLMIAILLAGSVAYTQLPVSALPQVDYPTIQVQTYYPGASPAVMTSAVTGSLERQFGQIPGLTQMTSVSSGGGSIITLQFNLSESIDVAQQDVQAAINAAQALLPKDLPNPPIYNKVNPADAPILTLALTSDTLPLTKVEDLADTILANKISQLLRCRSRLDCGRAETRNPHPGKPNRSGWIRAFAGRYSHSSCLRQRRSGEGQSERRTPKLHNWRERPVALCCRLHERDRRIPQRLTRTPFKHCNRS